MLLQPAPVGPYANTLAFWPCSTYGMRGQTELWYSVSWVLSSPKKPLNLDKKCRHSK